MSGAGGSRGPQTGPAGSVGVLALQGDFAAHCRALERSGCASREVRHTRQLDGLAGLVLPGGESTALLKLMEDEPWLAALRGFASSGGALFGTCAGAILLAREVRPPQASLGLLDAVVERNAYGRQRDSFTAGLDGAVARRGVFIRAPRFAALGPRVEVLARLEGEPVLVRQDRLLAACFHPELAPADGDVHRLFVELATGALSPS